MSQKSQVSANWLNLVWNAIRVLVLLFVIRKSRTQGFVLMWNNSQELSRGLSSAMAVVFDNASNISFTVSPEKWSNSACGVYSSMTAMATNMFLFRLSVCLFFFFEKVGFWETRHHCGSHLPRFGWKICTHNLTLFFLRGSYCRDQELHPLTLIASSQLTSLHQIRYLYNVSTLFLLVLQVRKTDAHISAK